MDSRYAEDFRFLNKSMLENNLVVFVGAGASVGSGFPLWSVLITAIKERMEELKDIKGDLIIPQMYYNARGRKDYVELIRELLYKPNAQPNVIHERIVKLNPRCIITTNYDDLLETAFNNHGVFLDVIEKDSDLPYTHTGQMIVKMHGGFRYNNFVLKEDDYLNYSVDFTLIENYVKALFARYTVLFVGYSFNDPDTKQIFNWIRSILKEDQQRAYLINISDECNSQTYNYYKNIGINVIFAKDFSDLPEDFTERAAFVLDKILMPESNELAKINETFKKYDIFNYVPEGTISDVLSSYFSCRIENGCLDFYFDSRIGCQPMVDYFQKEELMEKFPYIKRIFEKSSIERVVFNNPRKIADFMECEFDISATFPDVTAFEEFDYSRIEKGIADESIENSMFKSYCYCYFQEYLKCYETLKKAAKHYLLAKQLDEYLFVENTRIRVGKILKNHIFSPEKLQQIAEEIDNIESIGVYADNALIIKENQLLLNLIDFRYIYKKTHQIINLRGKLDKESRTSYFMYSGMPAYARIEESAKDLYRCLQCNYLMLDIYSETQSIYTLFIDSLLLSLSSNKNGTMNDVFEEETTNIALDQLSRFDVMIILRYVPLQELKHIIAKYKIDRIILNDEVFLYLKRVLTNLNSEYKTHKRQAITVFRKIFLLLETVDMTQELCVAIFETIQILIKDYNSVNEFYEVNSFICSQFHKSSYIFTIENIETLIKLACQTLSKIGDVHNNNFCVLLINLIDIYADIAPDNQLILQPRDLQVFSTLLPLDMLIHLFKIGSTELKKVVVEKVEKHLLDEAGDIDVYYNALIYNVIDPIPTCEDCLFAQAQKSTAHVSVITGGSQPISCAAILYLENKLLSKERFIPLIQHKKALGLLIEPSRYDYNEFNPEILLTLTDNSISIISNDEIARKSIATILRDYLLQNWNERLAKIYIKYFGKQ